MSITVPSIKDAKEYAKHDVVSDAEFCVLHGPEFYIAKYNRICDDNNIPNDVRQAYLEGINLGFDEVL